MSAAGLSEFIQLVRDIDMDVVRKDIAEAEAAAALSQKGE
jgi:L-cysteine desulfidase